MKHSEHLKTAEEWELQHRQQLSDSWLAAETARERLMSVCGSIPTTSCTRERSVYDNSSAVCVIEVV